MTWAEPFRPHRYVPRECVTSMPATPADASSIRMSGTPAAQRGPMTTCRSVRRRLMPRSSVGTRRSARGSTRNRAWVTTPAKRCGRAAASASCNCPNRSMFALGPPHGEPPFAFLAEEAFLTERRGRDEFECGVEQPRPDRVASAVAGVAQPVHVARDACGEHIEIRRAAPMAVDDRPVHRHHMAFQRIVAVVDDGERRRRLREVGQLEAERHSPSVVAVGAPLAELIRLLGEAYSVAQTVRWQQMLAERLAQQRAVVGAQHVDPVVGETQRGARSRDEAGASEAVGAAAYPYVISAESLDFVMSHSRSDPFEMIAQAVSSEQ